HGMLRERLEFRLPHRVHRELVLVVPADPAVQRRARIALGNLDPVVGEPQPLPLRRQRIEDLHPIRPYRRMPLPTVAIDQHRIGVLEHLVGIDLRGALHTGWPTVRIDLDL
ncbi:MAG: hypothetical protein ACK55I_11815, partial [bacterium]